MMTSTQIRQSFLDFFRSKQHTIVPSSSLMPDSPNLLFTNAGMNQFVPIFLNETKCPYTPGRAADTQKCIRAGGKHNDLDDVGLDTYHHTFFEMLGNWSFGDYFKQEAISWAWELVIEVWKFPPQRLYATVYNPDKSKGDPSEFDQEAWDIWAAKFRSVGLDPAVHIVNGNKKDNFWMMGDTGPCGPCSELHVDLTPAGDTRGLLVNKGSAECIEIWNNVFIQFNANPDGTFSPLPAKHVDTGMGFERVTSIMQGTKMFSDFANAKISNYETDIFRPLFDELEKMSGNKYGSTLPKSGSTGDTEQEKVDIAFRVIGDHIRTLSFAIADGIEPGAKGRNGVLRSIHKRMLRFASAIDVKGELVPRTQDSLVDTLATTMGDVFPEVRVRKEHIKQVLRREADVFSRTMDRGVELFAGIVERQQMWASYAAKVKEFVSAQSDRSVALAKWAANHIYAPASPYTSDPCVTFFSPALLTSLHALETQSDKSEILASALQIQNEVRCISGKAAFILSDTYGFPLDLTQLMARERGMAVDAASFNSLLEEQKKRSKEARVTQVIELSQIETKMPTRFLGYDALETPARVLEVVGLKDKTAVVLDTSTCYAEMGGQLGDTGEILHVPVAADVSRLKLDGADLRPLLQVTNTQKSGNTWLHFVEGDELPATGDTVVLRVNKSRRDAIQRHHTVTHLLHWALHEVVSREASQKGSSVGPDKLTFDFNSAALTPAQVADIEKLVNERILENAGVSWTEVPHADVKGRKDVMQFFGDKYGDTVRVVQIGGSANKLDGYSMELCGGTHTRATGEIGLFRIVGESAIAAGVRRIEAVAGLTAFDAMRLDRELIKSVAGKVSSPIHELEKKIEAVLAHQKELEKQLKLAVARNASNAASELLSRAHDVNGTPLITHNLGDADAEFLQAVADALKSRFKGVIVLGGGAGGAVTLIASVSADFTAKAQAGKLIQQIAPIVGGKGGGKPDNARGGGKDAGKLDEALGRVKTLLA